MRVLLVLTGLPDTKTPARSVFNLMFAEELVRYGVEVVILYLRAVSPKNVFLKETMIEGIKCYEVRSVFPKLKFMSNSMFSPHIFKSLLYNKQLREEVKRVDVVHAISGGSVEAAYIIARKFNLPMISQFIGSDLNTHFDSYLKKKNFMKGVSLSKYHCFESKGLEQLFLSRIKKDNTLIIYRGVRLDEFEYNFYKKNELRVLFLGGFPNSNNNLKGGITLIEALKLIKKEDLKRKLTLVIGGPNSLKFKHVFDEINIPNLKIDIIGAVEKSIVKKEMNKSHIVLIPSLSEGLPNVLSEAMASGNLIIASSVGGIPEVIENNVSGKLIPPNDSESLKQSILDCVEDFSEIELFAINARKRIEEMGYDSFIQGYIGVYKTLINNEN